MAVREFLLGEDGYRAAVDAATGIKTIQSLIASVIDLTWQINGGTGPPESLAAVVNLYPASPGSDAAPLQHVIVIGVGAIFICKYPCKKSHSLLEIFRDTEYILRGDHYA